MNEEKTMEEIVKEMDEMNPLEVGDTVTGVIYSIRDELVLVKLDYMFDGVLPLKELPEEERALDLKLEFAVKHIDNESGEVKLSRWEVREDEVLEKLQKSFEQEKPVKVMMLEEIKGGLRVKVSGLRGFMPYSQIDTSRVEDLTPFLGKEAEAIIIDWDPHKKNLVVSRRKALEGKEQAQKEAFIQELKTETELTGKVAKLLNHGALIDLGPALGFLHISQMSWRRVNNPAEILSVGDEIKVQVTSIDREEQKISLSMKDMVTNPWDRVHLDYEVGDYVLGKVVKNIPAGSIIELDSGVTGLLHTSQYTTEKPKEGQEVEVEILSIDAPNQRISLGVAEETVEDYEDFLNESKGATLGDLFKDIKDKL